ncbi:MAG: ABC transporter transmembrane domain-containing protein [Pseudomonadales bacterium]
MSEPEKKRISSLFALLTFVLPYKSRLVGAIAALLFTSTLTLLIGQGVRMLIDEGFIGQSEEQLSAAILLIVGLTCAMAVGTFVRFYLVSWLGERVSADLRRAVFDHIISIHPSYFEDNRSGEIMSRLTTDTTLLQSIIGSSFSMALRSTLTMSGALVMLLLTNMKLTLVIFGCVPLILLPILFYGRKVRALSRKSQGSIADVGTYAGEAIQNIKTVQSYTQEQAEKTAFGREVEKAFAIARRSILLRAIMISVVMLLIFGALAGMLWIGGNDVLSGKMSGGDLGAFVFYALVVAMSVGTIAEVFGELQRAAGATDRLLELMQVDNLITSPTEGSLTALTLAPELELHEISFNYPSRPDQPALKHFSLHIEQGKSLALVGPSGAGKSTVFELIQRFYDPQSGKLCLGGEDIRQLSPQELREQMALVPQQPTLFSADVMHNIRYGRPEASDEEVVGAAKAAHAHEFITQLPQGYQSYLGESGVRLSGGQKQRVAIARAVLKNPRILLLDEATSALDTESEYHVQQALEQLMQGRTTVIIAHRLSTILHADSIAVIDHGELVAQGKHEELLVTNELYNRLASLQFREEK